MLVLMAAVLAGFGELALRPETQVSCQNLSVCLDCFGAQGSFPNQSGLLCQEVTEGGGD